MQYMCRLVFSQVHVGRKRCIAARHRRRRCGKEAASKTKISAHTVKVVVDADVDEWRPSFLEAAWKILWAHESHVEKKRRICHTRRLDRNPR